MKENIHCTPWVPNKPIQLIKNIWISSIFQLPQARIFHHERKQTVQTISALQNILIDQEYLNKFIVQTAVNKYFHSVYHVCLTKQNATQLSKNSWRSSNSSCVDQQLSIIKENRQCKKAGLTNQFN